VLTNPHSACARGSSRALARGRTLCARQGRVSGISRVPGTEPAPEVARARPLPRAQESPCVIVNPASLAHGGALQPGAESSRARQPAAGAAARQACGRARSWRRDRLGRLLNFYHRNAHDFGRIEFSDSTAVHSVLKKQELGTVAVGYLTGACRANRELALRECYDGRRRWDVAIAVVKSQPLFFP
jgi:hypothetical protein